MTWPDIDSSDGEANAPPPIQLADHQHHHFDNFDSSSTSPSDLGDQLPPQRRTHSDDDWGTDDEIQLDSYDIPYDQTHRPVSTLDFDTILPDAKPLTVVNGDSPRAQSLVSRGRRRQRVDPYIHDQTSPGPPYAGVSPTSSGSSSSSSPESHTIINPQDSTLRLPVMSRQSQASPSQYDYQKQDFAQESQPQNYQQHEHDHRQSTVSVGGNDAPGSYDLKPPPPAHLLENMECEYSSSLARP